MKPPAEITFLASLPALQSAITFSGGRGDGARLKLDLPASEQDAALLLAYHARAKLLRVTISILSDEETQQEPEGKTARLDLRRS